MGLDFNHSQASWSYSGFNRFRHDLATLVGIDLDGMDGFGGNKLWTSLPPDPIHILLDHSDCEGDISALDCAKCGPRLYELASKLPGEYDRKAARLLACDMIECGKKKRTLEFH